MLPFIITLTTSISITFSDLVMDDWKVGTSNLPLALASAYIGYDNDENTIFIIGGGSCNGCSVHIEYDIDTDTFTRDPLDDLPVTIFSRGQSRAPQIDSKLYMLVSSEIHIYDLKSKIFMQNQIAIPIQTSSSFAEACLTGNDEYLYVIGGYSDTFLSTVLIYNLNSNSNNWANGPDMNTARASGSCIITSNNVLYAIAGDPWDAGNTVEFISITDMVNNIWVLTTNDLTQRVRSAQSILVEDYIFVIGGYGEGGMTNKIHIINTITNTISLSSQTLTYPVEGTMAIRVQDVIYAFGGYGTSNTYNTWQYTTIKGMTNEEEPDAECSNTYLTDLDATEVVNIGTFNINSFEQYGYESMLMGDGNTYSNFFVVTPPPPDQKFGYVIWNLNRKYKSFRAVIGLDGLTEHCVNGYGQSLHADGVKYKFYVDHILVYTSSQLIYASDFENIDIDVSNGNTLKVEIYNGINNWCDHAIIANPVLTCLTTVYNPSHSSGSCGWQLVYEHDLNGANIYGNIYDLIDDVNNGKDIRISVSCHGNCNLVYNQPQRTWIRNDRVYIYDEGSINLGWNDNDDPVFDTKIYKTVFDTNGLLNVWNDDENVVRQYQYAAKWFTRG